MRSSFALASLLFLATPVLAGSEVHTGTVSGTGAPMTQDVPIPQFDDHGGTRRLDLVTLDFLTSVIGGGTTNGSGIPTQVFAQLDANWSRGGMAILDTQAQINTPISNNGAPHSFTVFDSDPEQTFATPAPYVGTGVLLHQVFTQFQFSENPAGSTGFSAGGTVRWTVTYSFTVLDEGFCFGDTSLSGCPCGNVGLPGHGCDNAQATGGVLLASSAFAPNGAGGGTVSLDGSGFPPAANPAVVAIRASAPAPVPVVFGDGLRCIDTAGFARIGSSIATAGTCSIALVHGAGPGTFAYQLWYRNNPASFCDAGAAFNLSNGWQLTW